MTPGLMGAHSVTLRHDDDIVIVSEAVGTMGRRMVAEKNLHERKGSTARIRDPGGNLAMVPVLRRVCETHGIACNLLCFCTLVGTVDIDIRCRSPFLLRMEG